MLCLSLMAGILASCGSSKQNIVVLSDRIDSTRGNLTLTAPELLIQPDDELAINVTADVPAAAAAYNLQLNNNVPLEKITDQAPTGRVQTYLVNKAGDINFPILGKIHVAGMSTAALADMLMKRISENVQNPIVVVTLVNFQVNVGGDVQQPQVVKSTKERMTVLDALAAAGDINLQGRRDNVLIIREKNGETTYHRIDLTDSKTWDPEYYYLRQNDVVYVEPGPSRIDELTYNERRSYKVQLASIIVSSLSVASAIIVALITTR